MWSSSVVMLEYGYSLHGQVSRCPALQCPMGPAIEGQAAGYKRERPPTARGNGLRSHQAAPSPGVQKWGIAILTVYRYTPILTILMGNNLGKSWEMMIHQRVFKPFLLHFAAFCHHVEKTICWKFVFISPGAKVTVTRGGERHKGYMIVPWHFQPTQVTMSFNSWGKPLTLNVLGTRKSWSQGSPPIPLAHKSFATVLKRRPAGRQ